jgi:hypothetical protein
VAEDTEARAVELVRHLAAAGFNAALLAMRETWPYYDLMVIPREAAKIAEKPLPVREAQERIRKRRRKLNGGPLSRDPVR